MACLNFSSQTSAPPPPPSVSKYFINCRVVAIPWKPSGHPFRHGSCQDSRKTSPPTLPVFTVLIYIYAKSRPALSWRPPDGLVYPRRARLKVVGCSPAHEDHRPLKQLDQPGRALWVGPQGLSFHQQTAEIVLAFESTRCASANVNSGGDRW